MKRIAFFGVVLTFSLLASSSLPQEAAHQVFAPQTARDWQAIGESVVHAPMPQIAYVINGSVFVMNEDGANVRELLHGHDSVRSPKFSPDGRRIAFTSFADSRLFVVNTDGTGLTALADGEVGEIRTSPSFDPTGTKIAYGLYQTTGKVVGWIRVIDMDGGRDTVAVETGDEPKYVSWSPDDTKIVFDDVVRGRGGLYGVARAGNRWDDLGMLFRSPSSVSDIEWFDPRYAKPVATAPWDVNRDSVVDIRDLILVAQRFGESVLAAPQRIALLERLSRARSDEDIKSILNALSSQPKPEGKRLVRWAELKTRP